MRNAVLNVIGNVRIGVQFIHDGRGLADTRRQSDLRYGRSVFAATGKNATAQPRIDSNSADASAENNDWNCR